MTGDLATAAERIQLSIADGADEQEALDDYFAARGWSDGLPLVAPTARRVAAMLSGSPEPPQQLIGILPVANRGLTMEGLAINAVMAGCRPPMFRALLAAVKAMLRPEFNLPGVQATTHPAAPLAIFSGDVVSETAMNAGAGVYGPGNRALATIGRAIRLVLLSVGDGVPGVGDRATQGHPGKYTYAIAERSSAWRPLHERRGVAAPSGVTLVAAEAPRNAQDHGSQDAAGLLISLAATIASAGHNNLHRDGPIVVVLGPEHFDICARDGLGPDEIAQRIFALARVPVQAISAGNRQLWERVIPKKFANLTDDASVSVTGDWRDILVTTAGGDGKHSSVVPSFAITSAVTVPID